MTLNFKLYALFYFCLLSFKGYTQQTVQIDIHSDSFEKQISLSYPTIKYSYDSTSQTHNYSSNWDLDKDGINDEVYFIGTGGAHLYYFLKVVLSTDKKLREFDFIQIDFPLFTGTDTTNAAQTRFGFKVADLGKSRMPTILVRLDEQTFYNNPALKKRKIKTKNVMLSFENGKAKFGSL